MTKTELVSVIAEKNGVTKVAAGEAVKLFISGVTAAIENGDDVALTGFGTFKVTEVPERAGRNPQTGEALVVKAHNKVSFKPSSKLKEAANA